MAVTDAWDRLAVSNGPVGFVDHCLRGAGQVMFQNNPLTGVFFLAGITYGAIRAEMWEVALGSVVGLVVSTLTSRALRVDPTARATGLYGYNGILVGAALPTFLEPTARMWVYLVVGSAVSSVVMMAVANVMKTWGTPALTFPFVLTTWFLLLGAHAFANVRAESLSSPSLASAPSEAAASINWSFDFAWDTFWRGPAQVFLIANAVTGILFVIGLACSSLWAAGYALAGSAVAMGTAIVLGASEADLVQGLFGFSAVLTAIALGCTFYSPTWRAALYALLGTIFTVVVQGAMDAGLAPMGIPTLTGPFVFATWLFLLGKAELRPVGHHRIRRDVGSTNGHHPDLDADTPVGASAATAAATVSFATIAATTHQLTHRRSPG